MGDKAYPRGPTAPTCAAAASRPSSRSRTTKKTTGAPGEAGGGLPPAFDPEYYKQRNTVERCFSKLRQFRAVATRYDKRELIYQGSIDFASIRLWLRDPPHDLQDTP